MSPSHHDIAIYALKLPGSYFQLNIKLPGALLENLPKPDMGRPVQLCNRTTALKTELSGSKPNGWQP